VRVAFIEKTMTSLGKDVLTNEKFEVRKRPVDILLPLDNQKDALGFINRFGLALRGMVICALRARVDHRRVQHALDGRLPVCSALGRAVVHGLIATQRAGISF
jgi:hypothetical protein